MSYLELADIGEEDELLKEETHKFAEEVMRPASIKLDQMDHKKVAEKGSPYWDVTRKMKELGYHRIWVPKKYGGLELTPRQIHIIYEELGWGSVGLATASGVDVIPPSVMSLVGSSEIIEELLIPWMNDTEGKYHGCWPVTEPEHGSDWLLGPSCPNPRQLGKAQVKAEKDGDEWVISGAKSSWVSSAPTATHALVHVGLPESEYSMGEGGLAVIPLNTDGVIKGLPIEKLGLRDDPQGELIFENVRIPEHYMVVLAPEFYQYFVNQLLCATSCFMGTVFMGLGRAAFEEAYKYTRDRVQGGCPLIEQQTIKMRLYKMFEKIETARCYTRQVTNHVWEHVIRDQSYDASTAHALTAQVYGKSVAYEVAHEAVQLFGGYGLTKEFLVEKLFRDARSSLIMDGTTEVLGLSAEYEVEKNFDTWK